MGGIIVFILVGLVVGILARLLLPGRDPIGIIGTLLVGVVGAIIGGYLFTFVFNLNDDGGVAWIGSILMAMLLLFLYRKMTYGRDSTHTTV